MNRIADSMNKWSRSVPLWVTTLILALSGMLTSLTFTLSIALVPSLPSILDVSPNDASWVITVTLLTSSVVTPIIARMADMYGKRKMLVVSLLALVLGSVIVAAGDSFLTMLVGRGLQGFAPSLVPVAISLVRDLLPPERVGTAVALVSGTVGVGMALGLPLSGFLYGTFGWHAVFWFTAVAGSGFLAAILLLIRESPVKSPARFDWPGTLIFSAALAATLLVLSKAGSWEFSAILTLAGAAIVGFTVWVPLQLRTSNPMVDLRTTARKPIALTNLSSFFVTVGTFANMLITTMHVQAPTATGYGFGLSVLISGIVLLPSGLVMVVLAPFTGKLLQLMGGRIVLLLGNAVMALAYVFRSFISDSLTLVVIEAALVGVGTALSFAAMPTLIMASVPLTETAAANGINSLVRAMAMAVTSAFLAMLVTSMSVTVEGQEVLSFEALKICYLVASGGAAVGAVIAFLIPTDTRVREAGIKVCVPGRRGHDELLIRGKVITRTGESIIRSALVSFMRLDGTPVDWSRADHTGCYSVLLPTTGKYLVVTNTAGWAPKTSVVDLEHGQVEINFLMSERLRLSGVVSYDGNKARGAVVVLSRGLGDYVTSAKCDEDGCYSIPLPEAGPYILTAIDAGETWAHSQKLIVGVETTVRNLELTS